MNSVSSSEAQIDTASPEISGTIGRVLGNSDTFQSTWEEFLDPVETWHRIFETELSE